MDINDFKKQVKVLEKSLKLVTSNQDSSYDAIRAKIKELTIAIENKIEASKKTLNDGGLTLNDLNKKYRDKILYFNGDEDGSQFVYVEEIVYEGKFCVNGTMIHVGFQDQTIKIETLTYKPFEDFYYFDDDYDVTYNTCQELDKALQSRPLDTTLPSHVVEFDFVIRDIMSFIGWTLSDATGNEMFEELEERVKIVE